MIKGNDDSCERSRRSMAKYKGKRSKTEPSSSDDIGKKSFEDDIKAGFEIIHIDPSVDIHGQLTIDDILERVYELLGYCCEVANEKKDIIFEMGLKNKVVERIL